jgi:ferritin-like metal-binding protein YciE
MARTTTTNKPKKTTPTAAKNAAPKKSATPKEVTGAEDSAVEEPKEEAPAKPGLAKVFEEELKDIYGAEMQLTEALPKVAEAASHPKLKKAVTHHLAQTKKQIERLDKVFSLLSIEKEEKKCKAMAGLIEEGEEIIKNFEQGAVRDAALIIGSQKIEHYEIAAYGSLCELAEVMGKTRVADLLDKTLEEEEKTDTLLTNIAELVNDLAMKEQA